MRELSREASELLDVGREAFCPTEADRARVLAAVMGAAPLVAGAAVIGASKVSLDGLALLVRSSRAAQLLGVAMPVAAVGGLVWYATVSHPAAGSTTPGPAVPPGAAFSSPAALAPPRAEEAPRDEPGPSAPEPANEQVAAPPLERPAASETGQIRQEVALLSRAQAELSRGRPQQALEALREHAQRFPRGALSNERIATRARALCALGRTEEADAELDRMERLSPGSPYWARAREACSGK
jgi:hypothetical protein